MHASVNPPLSLSLINTLCLCSFIPSALRDHLHLPPFHFALSILVTVFSSLIKLIISHLINVPKFQPCLLVDGVRSLQQTVQHLQSLFRDRDTQLYPPDSISSIFPFKWKSNNYNDTFMHSILPFNTLTQYDCGCFLLAQEMSQAEISQHIIKVN